MSRIALVTHAGLPNLSDDDRLLLPALRRRGLVGEAAAWDDASVRWSEHDLVVLRSTWNYHLASARFLAWLDDVDARGARVWNPPALVRWNADKRYLLDLASRSIPIATTHLVERGAHGSLASRLEHAGWHEAVVKPTVSASAHETWLVCGAPTEADEARYRRLVDDRAVLVQRFIPQVVTEGEWSFVFIDGAFSHAVLKRPAAGDFRVQREHGGTAEPREPAPALLDDARAVLARLPHPTLYARVDGCALAGRLLLMELELIEPSLFLALAAEAPARLADAIARRLTG